MTEPVATYDVVVVGGGSAGAVVAARLSEDTGCRVLLLEAGGPPPLASLMPAACAALQQDPETDWMYTADPGEGGLGLEGRRMVVPRGKMLGGSSAMNYLAYVRGHPADFDGWANAGATGWSYPEVLPYFKKSEDLAPCDELPIDPDAHGTGGPLGVSLRKPVLPGARDFVDAAVGAGFREGDYNGRDLLAPEGVVSLLQTTTRDGKRSSTYHAFLEGAEAARPNLEVVCGAHVTRVLFDTEGARPRATGVEYHDTAGGRVRVGAAKEVVVCAGAVGSPHLLMLSGIGPRDDLERAGVACVRDAPDVGKHLKDHVQAGFIFPAPGGGVPMAELMLAMGPDALRAPLGPLPADPADDEQMSEELRALKSEAERRLFEWFATGEGLPSSSLYDAAAWCTSGLGEGQAHDIQLAVFVCGYTADIWRRLMRIDPDTFFDDAEARLSPEAETVIVFANPVRPHSEGEVLLASSDPAVPPDIRMHYFEDPRDMAVMVAAMRRVLDVASHWPARHPLGELFIPPHLARAHGYVPGAVPSDALLEDAARHYALTVYHLSCTCRIGSVVDPELRVLGIDGLRVADASVMPDIVSGNTNAATIMIGEKAAEMIADEHGMALASWVGPRRGRREAAGAGAVG